VGLHRGLLVLATILAAVAITLALDEPRIGEWILVAGSAALLYIADAFREIQDDARTLSQTTKTARHQATASVYESRGGWVLTTVFWLAAAGVVAGLAMVAFSI
jgi:hypothetical protein